MENEEKIYQKIEELKKLIPAGEQEAFQKCIEDIIEETQRAAFMDGYEYAIAVLKDGIVKNQVFKKD